MTKQIVFCLFLIAVLSCKNKNHDSHKSIPSVTQTDSFAAPKVTILADLPDSLQPKTVLLDTMTKPLTVAVPSGSGGFYSVTNSKGEISKIALAPPVITTLPVLKNAEGKIIKDSAGNPLIMGDGGVSHFTNFTTDNGLALDAITCSYMDRKGNLWFGSLGGALSRYDGKSFVTFSTAQGLANNAVNSIAEDRAGNLWFGTQGGLSRYDGKCFVTFSTTHGLANNVVLCIAEDHAGNLWFGTDGGGLSRYDPSAALRTGPSTPLRTGPSAALRTGSKSFVTFSTAQGLANNVIHSIVEDRAGNLWVGTDDGLSRYDPSAALRTGPSTSLTTSSKSFINYSTAQGLANNSVFCIAEDRAGNLWVGTKNGLSRYDPSAALRTGPSAALRKGSKSFVNFSTAQGLANNDIRSIAEDRVGNLWFGTFAGLSRYDPSAALRTGSKSFVNYSTAQGLACNRVNSIVKDRAGDLWFGTYGGGLSRYDGKSFVNFSTAQGLNHGRSVLEDRAGNLWFGTEDGLSRYDGKSFITFSTAQGLANNKVESIVEDRTGNLWFGTFSGLSRYDGKSFVTFSTTQGLADNRVRCITEDRAGNLWFGTERGGVSRYDGKSFVTFSTTQGLANNRVLCVIEDRAGNLWFGTDGGGLSRYDGKSFITFSTVQGLASNNVYSIAEDQAGNFWVGTSEGLSVLPREQQDWSLNKTGSQPIFKSFTKADGLPDNFVTQILQMPDGKIAIGTNLGITLFRPSSDLTSLQDIEIYNSLTGYPVKDINVGQHCMFLDSKGFIWAGTGSDKTALVRFDPSALRKDKDTGAQTPMIQSIKISGQNICWLDLLPHTNPKREGDSLSLPANITEEVSTFGHALTQRDRDTMKQKFGDITFDSITPFYPVPQHLVLPYRHNDITIDFNAIETGKPALVRYQYFLEGYDDEWSPVLANSSATFGNIREGSYTFKVKARSPNGIWSAPVTYSFKVLPPPYRTWWAFLIYALLFLGALRIFSKWRERTLQAEKTKLEHTVEKRTEELVQKNIVVEKERQRSDELLLNILPAEIAAELKATGVSRAKQFDNVTVIFTDFVNFTGAGEKLSPQGLIDELHACFMAFDEITAKYNIEKIKTIGDAYLAVAGLPLPDPDHAVNAIKAALEIRAFAEERHAKQGSSSFQIRIGINSGSVVAGIVGVKKFAYDIWGDTVNIAARMEQGSEAGKINISQTTYELVKEQFSCVYRGEVAAKHKGQLKMYFVEGKAAG